MRGDEREDEGEGMKGSEKKREWRKGIEATDADEPSVMQSGFVLLEVGCSRSKNSMSILIKNIGDIAVGFLAYFLVGYAFAYGSDGNNGFIGSGSFALSDVPLQTFAFFFSQSLFVISSSTIVSGALVGRTAFQGYFVHTAMYCSIGVTVVSHWIWADGGWLSANNVNPLLGSGAIDFAGSGVVHLCGGIAAIIGAKTVGRE
eukprot:TRINITY_DN7207_c0_g1_i1.p1 TRINITY_DN7207_c0_g1~~TRINITY_DN7207_c0_g1_i1.p1  ORF type:complete len:202 (-),score=46.26 TRINITY_DN7207_c0_g1_i1:104-709(-)